MRPRVGHIQFLNCLPIYYGLVEGSGILDLELVKGTPTELNELLLSGRLDISPISSIEFARHPDQLLLLPGPTVSSRGPVQSILFLSRRAPADLDGRPVALTSSSATSHVLLKILLEKRYGSRPAYHAFDGDPSPALSRSDGVLLIGDQALEHRCPEPGFTAYDLGREWLEYAGFGMVFAVWAVRRDFAARHPDLVRHVGALFRRSIDYCTASLDRIALDAARWEKFPAAFLEEYFRTLDFGFEDDLRRGLQRFYRQAAEIGALDQIPDLEFFTAGAPVAGAASRTGGLSPSPHSIKTGR